jgi:hypothetical protein
MPLQDLVKHDPVNEAADPTPRNRPAVTNRRFDGRLAAALTDGPAPAVVPWPATGEVRCSFRVPPERGRLLLVVLRDGQG